ncbi:MAG: LON peptidase substrate-binding domain-containing protein, partial [Ottowia sp.]|nr:LON peptidase substrate-binding domain-containing protein [Ottowia sp.]
MSRTTVSSAQQTSLPLLPLRDVVVFPHMVIPLFVGRAKSIRALEVAMAADRRVVLVAQKNAGNDDPQASDLFDVGCIASILQMLKLPDGTVKVLIEGGERARIATVGQEKDHWTAEVEVLPQTGGGAADAEAEALRRAVLQQFDQYVKLNKKIPSEIMASVSDIEEGDRLADTIAAHLPLKLEEKQHALSQVDVRQRLESLLEQLQREVDIL